MGIEYVKNGYKITISRNRTHVTTYQDMRLQTTHPIKEDKPKKIKPTIPSNYADHNYYNRMKNRRKVIREICMNNFALPNVVMITLTFDQTKSAGPEKSYTDISSTHYEFKKFIQRINSHYDNFKYIVTFNRQSNGNWHYHMMCNFPQNITNNVVKEIWGKGITYVTYIESQEKYKRCIQYLIDNMNESAGELKGKKGYLTTKGIERDIIYKSWNESEFKDFQEAFEKIEKSQNRQYCEKRNHLGIKRKAGESSDIYIEDRELNPMLENAGYENWDTIYTYLTSSADFSDKFSELKPATLKTKKWKRNNHN